MTRSKGHSYNPKGRPWFVPEVWIRRGRIDDGDYVDTYDNTTSYELNVLQRIFVTMEYPNSSFLSQIYAWSHTIVIILCVIVSYLGTSEIFQYIPSDCPFPGCKNDASLCPDRTVCSPESDPILWQIDIACYIFYSIDLGARMLLSPLIPCRILGIITKHWDVLELKKPAHLRREEPGYPWYEKSLRYLFTFNNVIDLIATVPYFVELCINSNMEVNSRSSAIVVTTVRLGRCVRLLKLLDVHPEGSPRLNIIIKSFKASAPSLILLLGIVLISSVVFGSLIYTAEHGYFRVTPEYPDGAYFRRDIMGEWERTPFQNLGTCMYWAIVTMTTLGYGDLYPSTAAGRVVGSICCIFGIIAIAMPVTVVNNSFSSELGTYKSALKVAKKYHKKQVEEHERHERMSEASGKSAFGSRDSDRYFSEISEIPHGLVRKSKMTSPGLFHVPYEISLDASEPKEPDKTTDAVNFEQPNAEQELLRGPSHEDNPPGQVQEGSGPSEAGTPASAGGASVKVPYMFREANKIHIIAKEIVSLKETLSSLEQSFDELFLEESGRKSWKLPEHAPQYPPREGSNEADVVLDLPKPAP